MTLPPSYLAEFSNSEFGAAEQRTQTTDTIDVPDKYLKSGNPIYIWIVLKDEEERTTRYAIIAPVRGRGEPIPYVPTPSEQTAIEEAVAALNTAVAEAQEAITHYPKVIDDYWYVWDVIAGEYVTTGVKSTGEDGVSPIVTVESITGGHRVTITDANGDHVFDVLDGVNGDPGRGIATIAKTGTSGLVDTYTITYTNGDVQTYTVTNGADGVSPTIVVSSITGGHRVTITDAEHPTGQSFDVLDGINGNDGVGIVSIEKTGTSGLTDTYTITYTDGTTQTYSVVNGANGFSPSISVSAIIGGHRITVTDANGTRSFDVMDGVDGVDGRGIVSIAKTATSGLVDTYTITYTDNTTSTFTVINGKDGDEGYSPTIAVTEITGGHRVTVTNKSGSSYFDVLDGQPGQPGPVQDVQVGGVSVLDAQGVANVPQASYNDFGAVRVQQYGGLQFGSTGLLKTDPASEITIKAGTDGSRPIAPNRQHASTFYGLAKVAGDTTQSASSNAVGNYTDAAKVAIQKMLGIYEAPWELIREDTVTNATEADIEITVDGNGNAFELTDVAIAFTTPTQETQAKFGGSGIIQFYYGVSDYLQTWNLQWTQAANASAYGTFSIVENRDGLVKTGSMQSSTSVAANFRTSWASSLDGRNMSISLISNFAVSKVVIKAVTGTGHYKLYGKRKWN